MKQALFLLSLAACAPKPTTAPTQQPEATSSITRWVQVRDAADVSMLEVPAEVRGDLATSGAVDVPYAARIARIFVKVGDHVERGAPIVAVVVPQVLSAAGAYIAASTRLAAQEQRQRRLKELQAEGLAKTSDTVESEARVADAKAERATALATLKGAGVEEKAAASLLDHDGTITLTSPVTGVIVALDAALGETREGAGRPIARIAGAGGRRIEAHLARTPPNDATYTLVMRNGRNVPLTLVNMSPAIDPIDGARMAWFDAPADANLSVGSRELIRITLAQDVVVVPATSLATRDQTTRVRRKDDWVAVEVLASSGADALVKGGLAVGDTIALDGQRMADHDEQQHAVAADD